MLAKPSKAQYEWHELERIMFIHFGPATWQGREGDDLSIPPAQIHPHSLDTEQWCEAALSWGAKAVIMVAKHVGGFCWWQTDTTDYGVKETPWKGGKGDVMTDLSRSCERHGLQLGVYVSPRDDYNKAAIGGVTADPADQERYSEIYRRQWTEVLSRYGPISELWFDGSSKIPLDDIIDRYAPNAAIFQSPRATIRWCGNEEGRVPYPAWNALKREKLESGVSTNADGDPDGDVWAPLEVDTTLYERAWFWSPEKSRTARSLDDLVRVYYESVGHGTVLLLNSNPDTRGLIPEADMEIYRQLGDELRKRFDNPAAEIQGRGEDLEIDLGGDTAVNHAVIMEDYREGERIREYRVEGFDGQNWISASQGTAVGRMKIDHFDPITVSKVRLRVTRSASEPLIRKFAVYNTRRPAVPSSKP